MIGKKTYPWLLMSALGGVAFLAGCGISSGDQPDVAASTGDTVPSSGRAVAAPPEWEHVHNLALRGSRLLVGTHEGLWVQAQGQSAQLVSDPPFDVMGLALSGQRVLASGHPAEGQDRPADLGLQESTDDGVTWTNVSLEGEVDFHRLSTAGGVILGVSSEEGMLLRSTDAGESWSDLGTPGLFDLAVNPADAQLVVGTTEQGPVTSEDGGESFTPVGRAPLLALLSWTPNRLYGITPEGALHVSTDDGATWEEISQVPGQPTAMAAQGNGVAVLAGDTVFYSTDGGATFAPRVIEISGG